MPGFLRTTSLLILLSGCGATAGDTTPVEPNGKARVGADVHHDEYTTRLRQKVAQEWRPDLPEGFLRRGFELVALLEIQQDGKLRRASIRKTSGDIELDDSVLRAIYSAQPYELPPGAAPADEGGESKKGRGKSQRKSKNKHSQKRDKKQDKKVTRVELPFDAAAVSD